MSGWLFKKTDTWAIDPENLTELGRQYQQQAMRDERRAVVWGVGGFAILTGLLAPTQDSLIAIGLLVAVLGGFYLWGRRIRRGRATRIEGVLASGLNALMLFKPIK